MLQLFDWGFEIDKFWIILRRKLKSTEVLQYSWKMHDRHSVQLTYHTSSSGRVNRDSIIYYLLTTRTTLTESVLDETGLSNVSDETDSVGQYFRWKLKNR